MGGNKGRDIRKELRKKKKPKKRPAPRRAAKPRGPRLSPRSLSIEELARGLKATPAGPEISLADLEADLEAGFAPNPDGTVDLVRYVAWLLRRHGYGRSSGAGAGS